MDIKSSNQILPEEIVLAVLHKVGKNVVINDYRIAQIFDNAASQHGGIFQQFKSHPQYHYSRLLDDVLRSLNYGGSIVRNFNQVPSQFWITSHTAGRYGKSVFKRLSNKDSLIVEQLADEIRDTSSPERSRG